MKNTSTENALYLPPWTAVIRAGVCQYFAASEDFAFSNFYLDILSTTFMQCSVGLPFNRYNF